MFTSSVIRWPRVCRYVLPKVQTTLSHGAVHLPILRMLTARAIYLLTSVSLDPGGLPYRASI